MYHLLHKSTTQLHRMVRQGQIAHLATVLAENEAMARKQKMEDTLRQRLLVHKTIRLMSDYLVLLDSLAQARQQFFPAVDTKCIIKEINDILVQTGGLANVMDVKQRTLLHEAVLFNQPAAVKLLLQHHVLTDIRDVFEKRAIDYAIVKDHVEIARLLAPSVTIEERNEHGDTVLHEYAVRANICQILLEQGKSKFQSIKSRAHLGDLHGNAPFMRLAQDDVYLQAMQYWIQFGIHLGSVNKRGETSLSIASKHGARGTVELLLAQPFYWRKERLSAKDLSGLSALEWARARHHKNIEAMLCRAVQ